jgi:hypothetical protein
LRKQARDEGTLKSTPQQEVETQTTSTGQRGAGSTIASWDDLRVDPIHDADDHSVLVLIDRGATLITQPSVSQCQ